MDHLYVAECDCLGREYRIKGRDGLASRLKELNMQQASKDSSEKENSQRSM